MEVYVRILKSSLSNEPLTTYVTLTSVCENVGEEKKYLGGKDVVKLSTAVCSRWTERKQ